MSQRKAYFVAMSGMPGCLADYTSSAMEFETRRDLVEFVSAELDSQDFSQRARRQVDLVRVWRWIQANGCSARASFVIGSTNQGDMRQLEFRALTAEEFEAWESEDA